MPTPQQIASNRSLLLVVFCFALLGLFLYYLFIDFKGLSHEAGMEQAQIGREMARGNGFVTKSIRPIALSGILERNPEASKTSIPDTYYAPLAPTLLSVVFRPLSHLWEWQDGTAIFFLDRVVAGFYMLMLVAAVGLTFVLLSRLFDTTIASVASLLMVMSAPLWHYAQSGLPQTLMLLLFCGATYLLHRGVVVDAEGRSPVRWLALSGLFFGLLALTNWLSVWIFFGAVLYAGAHFRRTPIATIALVVVFCVMTIPWLVRNYLAVGDALGIARYIFYGGLNSASESMLMRHWNEDGLTFSLVGLPTKLILNTVAQTNNLYLFLGSVAVAPLFFLSFVHRFRRPDVASFRWGILAMWVSACLGMALFGINAEDKVHPKNLHILFIPLAAGYGLAFLSILWSRLAISQNLPLANTGHFVLAALISGLPLVLTIPRGLKTGLFQASEHRQVNWPPYLPSYYDRFIAENTEADEVVFADVAWAVSWYGDRPSYWLPYDVEQFNQMKTMLDDSGTASAGLLITPRTTHLQLGGEIMNQEFAPWSALIMHGAGMSLGVDTLGPRKFAYSRPHLLTPRGDMVFYSDRKIW